LPSEQRWGARNPMSSPYIQRLALFLGVGMAISFPQCRLACQQGPGHQADHRLGAHLGKGYDALKQEHYDVAAEEFRAALRLDPKLVMRARFPLAVALFEQNKSDESRREFEVVRKEVGDHPSVMYYLGRLDLANRNFESAARNLNLAIAKPPFPDTAYQLGFAFFKLGDLKSAEKWLQEAVRTTPEDAGAQYQLGLVYRQEKQEENAKKALAKAQELRQRGVEDSRLKLECRQKLDEGAREEARKVCDRMYDPESAEKLTALGTLYAQHGDLEAALKPLQRAVELNPQSPQMQYNLALAHYQLNQFAEARPPVEQAIERWPDLFQLNALYGAILFNLGDDAAAYRTLHHAQELNPQDTSTTDLLFLTALRMGRNRQSAQNYSEAVSYFQEAAKLKPQEPAPHRGLAQIYVSTGHPDKAKTEEQEAEHLAQILGAS
jgi:Flp pilus assembly protein TadD